jgi:hypothetical protein
MELFLGTLIIILICCFALALGTLVSGNPLEGGCGKRVNGSDDCTGCPGRDDTRPCKRGY